MHDADWFLKAEDDTYVIMENLGYFLSKLNPSEPHYIGRICLLRMAATTLEGPAAAKR